MQIVVPGALPDPAQLRALAPHINRVAPTLQRWRSRGRARTRTAMIAQTGCTAYEQWRLTQRGFVPEAGQSLAAGLGPLLAEPAFTAMASTQAALANPSYSPDQTVWLAELVHIALASDGAALMPARRLEISMQDSQALLASAQTLCADSGFVLQPHSATHWRVIPPQASNEPFTLRCASPELVATSSVHDWWPQDTAARVWRQLFNALQMHWFDHPVNRARAARGLLPINGLWLFGGARPAQLPPEKNADVQVHSSLYDAWLEQDWGAWLQALADLERTVFAPMAHAPDVLVLIGQQDIVEIRRATGINRLWQWFMPG